MTRKTLLLILLPLIFTMHTACTSSDSKEGEDVEQSDAIEQELVDSGMDGKSDAAAAGDPAEAGGEAPAEGGGDDFAEGGDDLGGGGGDEFAADEGGGDDFGDGGDEFAAGEGEAPSEDLSGEGNDLEDLDNIDDSEMAESDGDASLEEGTQVADSEGAPEAAPGEENMGSSPEPLGGGEEMAMAQEEAAPLGSGEEALMEEPRADLGAIGSTESAPSPMAETEASVGGFSEPAKNFVSVKKIASEPYRKAGKLVNAVYIARNGDTIEGVSQKIYGSEARAEELLNINTTLRRGVKVGDKIYYNSPQRPNDSSQLLTFYEDAGLAPEEYVTQNGDNIRSIAKKLLGHNRSWMELYATNMEVESKGEVQEGLRLRYWASTSNISATPPPAEEPQEFAAAEPPPEPAQEEMSADLPPPPDTTVAMNDLPPPPPGGSGGASDLPPPPPPMNDAPDLPPPPDLGAQGKIAAPGDIPPPQMPGGLNKLKNKKPKVASGGMGDDTLLLGAGALLILLGLALFIVKKKKSSKQQTDIDFHTATHTQID